MIKPWVISNFLKEMTDGFYVDVYPESDLNSSTKLLSSEYRWRGISITPTPIEFQRPNMFKSYVIDLKTNPAGLVNSIYLTHPGTMIHYLKINGIEDPSEIFNKTYEEDVIKPYEKQPIYPHLNFICIEIVGSPNDSLSKQLYEQFDVIWNHRENGSDIFVNEVLSYLI